MMGRSVSVIIPVYNSEKHVKKCIDSFINQTYHGFELILIDDGSTDHSLNILRECQRQYPDIVRVYSQKNQGVAITRNNGIRYATGKYLMFADNDDYVEPDYLETMVLAIENQQSDMVICSCRKVDEAGRILYEQILTDDDWSKYRIVAPWARIMNRQAIIDHKIEFGNFKLGEDSFFSITAYNELEHIVTIPYIGYNWVHHGESVSNTIQKKGIASPIPFLEALMNRNQKMKSARKDYFEYFIIKFIVWNLYYICDSVDSNTLAMYCDKYFTWLKKNLPMYKKNRLVSLKKPEGELLSVRVLVCFLAKSPKWMHNPSLFLLGRLKHLYDFKK